MKRGMQWSFDHLVNFDFIHFLFLVKELSFRPQFFFFNFDFFYQWWQIIKRNAVLFTKKLRCGRVMVNEWLIMSGLMENWFTKIISLFMCTKCRLKNFAKLLQRKKNDMNKTPLSQILQKVTLVSITAE